MHARLPHQRGRHASLLRARQRHWVGVLLLAVAPACGLIDPGYCTDELRIALSPQDASVKVGESFTASAQLSTCGGRTSLADDFSWFATDSLVISVTPAGRVTGLRAGTASAVAVGRRYGQLPGLAVTVR